MADENPRESSVTWTEPLCKLIKIGTGYHIAATCTDIFNLLSSFKVNEADEEKLYSRKATCKHVLLLQATVICDL